MVEEGHVRASPSRGVTTGHGACPGHAIGDPLGPFSILPFLDLPVPHGHQTILARRNQTDAIGTSCQAEDGSRMAAKGEELATRRRVPDLDGAVPPRGREPSTAQERDSRHDIRMPVQPQDLGAGRHIGEPYRFVNAACKELTPVRTEPQGRGSAIVDGDGPETLAIIQIAKVQCAILGDGGEVGALGVELDRTQLAMRQGETEHFPMIRTVPDPERAIRSGGREVSAIDGKSDASDVPLMAAQARHFSTFRAVPQANRAII